MYLPEPEDLVKQAEKHRKRGRSLILLSVTFSILFLLVSVIFMAQLNHMGRTVSLSGDVKGVDGQPLSNITVKAYGGSNEYIVQTDENGSFHIGNVKTGDITLEIGAEGCRDVKYRITLYNFLNEKGKVYHLPFTLDTGEGVDERGSFGGEVLRNVCGILMFIFTTASIFQMMGLIAVKKDRLREAKAMCVIGIFSFGFGVSTAFSALAYIHLHRATTLNRLATKIIIKKKADPSG